MESLVMTIYDYNDHRKNSLMGSATFAMEALKEDATQEGLEALVLKDGKERGQLRYDVSFYPVLKPQAVNGKEELPETSACLRIRIAA
jgi:Ca2+-dependent lipid-binding protein